MLAEALRLLRVFHDLKQSELAQALEISRSHVSEIESGNRVPSLEVLQKYARAFKVPISSVLFFAEQLEASPKNNDLAARTKTAIASKIIRFLQVVEERTEPDA